MVLGREEIIKPLVVKHSFAASQEVTTMTGWTPMLMVKTGPYLSAKAPNGMWEGRGRPPNRRRCPTTGHLPATLGGLQPLAWQLQP